MAATTAVDESALVDAIIRVRAAGGATTAAECFAVLEAEKSFDGLTLSAVKKAAGKATKKAAKEAPAAAAKPALVAAPHVVSEAKAAKQAKASAQQLKQAENHMMDMQRKLRAAKTGGDVHAMAVNVDGSIEQFIQTITTKAIAGVLDEGEEKFLKFRVEADIAALDWVRLAMKAGALTLAEDVCALGNELQLNRLRELRDSRNPAEILACYTSKGSGGSIEDVDKLVAATRAHAAIELGGELADID